MTVDKGASVKDEFPAQDSANSLGMGHMADLGIKSEKTSAASLQSKPTTSFIKRDAQTYGVKYKPEKEWGFFNPRQAKDKHLPWIRALGRVGWGAKAVIYGMIGGLACDNAVGDKNSSASPQGAFVIIGTANGGRGALILLACALATYSAWRYWEAIVGQGYDDNFSKMKNFFKFRLSPFVSGSVYVAYNVLVITTIPRDANQERDSLRNSTWPNGWRNSGIGKAGLVVCGLAFIAATVVQLEQFFTRSFHNTIKHEFKYMPQKFWKAFRIFTLVIGHIGVLGRGGIFIFAAVLFFRTLEHNTATGKSAFGDALGQLENTKAGCAALFIMGFMVILYGAFALINCYARYFPTPPPTGYKKQHRRQYDPDGILPQYGSNQTGFNPLQAAQGKMTNQPPSDQPRQHAYLSPMTNAANSHARNASADMMDAVNGHGPGVGGHPTGYPTTTGQPNVPQGNTGVSIRQIGEEV